MRFLFDKTFKAILSGNWKLLGQIFTDDEIDQLLESHPNLKKKLENEVIKKLKKAFNLTKSSVFATKGFPQRSMES
jgi:hypothetical protein